MTGIPSEAGAQWVLGGVARVLLRVMVLVGIVVGGWLLGAATALGGEDRVPGWPQEMPAAEADGSDAVAPDDRGLARLPAILVIPTVLEGPAGAPLATAPSVETNLDELPPATEVLQRSAPGTGGQLVHPVLTPVVEPVLHVIASVPGDQGYQQAPSSRTTARAEPPVPSHPARVTTPATAAPASPQPRPDLTVRGAPTPPRSTAAGAGPSAAGGDSAPSIPASLLGTAPSSCPIGPTGANPTAPGSPGGTLTDGVSRADLALLQHRGQTSTGGLPRCPSQQPSTSPD